MRFLVDANLSHRVARLLREAGLDATHVRDHEMQHAADVMIMGYAREHSFVVVSEDTDFGELLARQRAVAPSLVLLRTYEPMTPDEQAAVLVANMSGLVEHLAQGAVAVVERTRLRVRRLPLLPPVPDQRTR